jgi:hypothetical protein
VVRASNALEDAEINQKAVVLVAPNIRYNCINLLFLFAISEKKPGG